MIHNMNIGSDFGMVRNMDIWPGLWSGIWTYGEDFGEEYGHMVREQGEEGHPLSAAGTVVDPCCIRLPKQMKKQ